MPVLLGLWAVVSPALAGADRIIGHWKPRPDRPVVISVRPVTGGYEGFVSHNPRTPERVGDVVLQALRYDDEADAWTGTIYAPERQRSFDIVARVEQDEEAGEALQLRISTLFGTFERRWKRVPPPAGEAAEAVPSPQPQSQPEPQSQSQSRSQPQPEPEAEAPPSTDADASPSPPAARRGNGADGASARRLLAHLA